MLNVCANINRSECGSEERKNGERKRECKGVEVATAANDTKKTTQSIIIIEDDYIVGTSGKA